MNKIHQSGELNHKFDFQLYIHCNRLNRCLIYATPLPLIDASISASLDPVLAFPLPVLLLFWPPFHRFFTFFTTSLRPFFKTK